MDLLETTFMHFKYSAFLKPNKETSKTKSVYPVLGEIKSIDLHIWISVIKD